MKNTLKRSFLFTLAALTAIVLWSCSHSVNTAEDIISRKIDSMSAILVSLMDDTPYLAIGGHGQILSADDIKVFNRKI